jgi:hypothetical protein
MSRKPCGTLAVISFQKCTTGHPKPVLYNHAAVSNHRYLYKDMARTPENDSISAPPLRLGPWHWYGTVEP